MSRASSSRKTSGCGLEIKNRVENKSSGILCIENEITFEAKNSSKIENKIRVGNKSSVRLQKSRNLAVLD